MPNRDLYVWNGNRLSVFRSELNSLEDARRLQTAFADVESLDNPGAIEVDLTHCRYMSSMFIGILIASAWAIQERGGTVLFLVCPRLKQYFDTGQLGHVIEYIIPEDCDEES